MLQTSGLSRRQSAYAKATGSPLIRTSLPRMMISGGVSFFISYTGTIAGCLETIGYSVCIVHQGGS